jgi:hypothetical protein
LANIDETVFNRSLLFIFCSHIYLVIFYLTWFCAQRCKGQTKTAAAAAPPFPVDMDYPAISADNRRNRTQSLSHNPNGVKKGVAAVYINRPKTTALDEMGLTIFGGFPAFCQHWFYFLATR